MSGKSEEQVLGMKKNKEETPTQKAGKPLPNAHTYKDYLAHK